MPPRHSPYLGSNGLHYTGLFMYLLNAMYSCTILSVSSCICSMQCILAQFSLFLNVFAQCNVFLHNYLFPHVFAQCNVFLYNSLGFLMYLLNAMYSCTIRSVSWNMSKVKMKQNSSYKQSIAMSCHDNLILFFCCLCIFTKHNHG